MSTPKLEIESLVPWISVRFSRSPGPGGQNVNKVNTKVTLLFDVVSCTALSDPQKAGIRRKLATRISREGKLRVVSSRERTQGKNRAAAEERLIELLTEATARQKTRRKTQPTVGSRRRRLETKRQRSQLKQERKAPRDH